jgi:iron complex transport system substrate-binding protein
MRVVSLLPAATEIVSALGLVDQLVGVSHECDYPAAAGAKPKVTACEIHAKDISSHDIDQWVSQKLHQGEDLFTLDEKKLHQLQPDLILTQKLCDVCAPAYGSVTALGQTLPGPPKVLNLEPSCLEDILHNIQEVADALQAKSAATQLLGELRQRIAFVQERAAHAVSQPRVAVIEWLEPVFCSGHWTPGLVEMARGIEVLGRPQQDSGRRTWADVHQAQPDILVIACCGQSASRASEDWNRLQDNPDVQALKPVQQGKVFIADGNAYFSRPGPRVVDTLEILAEIIHPELFGGLFPNRGVLRMSGSKS